MSIDSTLGPAVTRAGAPDKAQVNPSSRVAAHSRAEGLRTLGREVIHLPGDPGYDVARVPWQAAVDQRPAAVATPGTAAETATVVRSAVRAGLRVAPQSTGHNAAPLAPGGDRPPWVGRSAAAQSEEEA